MQQTRATLRYAKALFSLAKEEGKLNQCQEDMQCVVDTCSNSKELIQLLKSPIIKTDQKKEVFKKLFYDKMDELSTSFINIIANKRREPLLDGIAKSYIALYRAHKNIETAHVTTAFNLDDELKKEVIGFIKKFEEKQVELTEKIDENIIGGAIIRMGDKQIDASVRTSIHKLKQKFNKNLYIKDF